MYSFVPHDGNFHLIWLCSSWLDTNWISPNHMSLVFCMNLYMWLGSICSWTNSYIRIGKMLYWVWDQNKRSPLSSNDMMGIIAAICLRWIGWKMKNYESGARDNKALFGEQGVSDLNHLLPEVEVWKLFGVTHRHMWQTERQNTQCQKQHKRPVMMNLATYTNS